MLTIALLVALLVTTGGAAADESRNVPAVGSKLTYRSVSTTTIPRATLTTGEVFTYIVTAAEANSAEGIIKPRAVIIKCKEDGSDLFCKSAAERPGAHFDGALLTVPITSDIGDALAKQSAFKYAYFIQEIRKFPMPGARDPYGSDLGDIGPEPAYIPANQGDNFVLGKKGCACWALGYIEPLSPPRLTRAVFGPLCGRYRICRVQTRSLTAAQPLVPLIEPFGPPRDCALRADITKRACGSLG
jgi:hypothetical protein